MRKIETLSVILVVDEGNPPERDRSVRFLVEYVISDVQDPHFRKAGRLHLNEKSDLGQAILFEVYGAVNAQEGSAFDVGGKPLQDPISDEEKVLLDCWKKRLTEYPSAHAWMEADYEARVEGNTSKRDLLDKQVTLVRKKYPSPSKVTPTAWRKVKAFFGM